MLVKTLKSEDFPLLKQVPDGIVLDPEACKAIVAMDGDEVVGRMYLVQMMHLEGTWIREDHRGGSILFRMEQELLRNCEELGIKAILAFVETAEYNSYLKRRGYKKMPWSIWGKEL